MTMMTVKEAAKRLNISEDAVRKRIARGILSAYKNNNRKLMVDLPEEEERQSPSNGATNENSENSRLLKLIEDQQEIIRTLVQQNGETQEQVRDLLSKNEKLTDLGRKAMALIKENAAKA